MLKFLITEESFASKDCSDWLTLVLFNSPLPLLKASVTTAVENITETRNKVLELRLMIKSHSNSKPGNLAQVCFGSQHAKKDRSGGSSCWHPAKLQLNQRKMIMPKLSELCLSGSLNMHHDLSLGSGHLESLWSSSVWQHCSLDGDLHLALGAVLCRSSASPSLKLCECVCSASSAASSVCVKIPVKRACGCNETEKCNFLHNFKVMNLG